MPSAAELVDALTLEVPDFPQPGILFRDLTPVLADGAALRAVTDRFTDVFDGGFDLVAGIEARGFLLAAAAAYAVGAGVLAVRKAGKLPPATLTEHYELEYGSAALEIRQEALQPGTRVLVLDDVLATGGTVEATCALLERAGAVVAGVGVVLELAGLGGRDRLTGRRVEAIRVV
ncbi:adenine phosphoribosyltransferase [Amnibacterium endophyticum]|uniref:Adenine phosphoribosyltransferase n=1 Tax=Amnibacterium endophyticum TaxID=2109337 RepID=A0ABW4LGZ7_9MICO